MDKAKTEAALNLYKGYQFGTDVGDIIGASLVTILYDKHHAIRFTSDAVTSFPWLEMMISVPTPIMKRDTASVSNFIPGALYYLAFYACVNAARLHRYTRINSPNTPNEQKDTAEIATRNTLIKKIDQIKKKYSEKNIKITEDEQVSDLKEWTDVHIDYLNFLCQRNKYIPIEYHQPEITSPQLLSKSSLVHFSKTYTPLAALTPRLYALFDRYSKQDEKKNEPCSSTCNATNDLSTKP